MLASVLHSDTAVDVGVRIMDASVARHQYQSINVKSFGKVHDRHLCINNNVYHIGNSLKGIGKRRFLLQQDVNDCKGTTGKCEVTISLFLLLTFHIHSLEALLLFYFSYFRIYAYLCSLKIRHEQHRKNTFK